MYRNHFPIFANNPDLIYLDSASTTQKPGAVIDAMGEFLRQDYANIHRGAYGLSERSEEHYHASKKTVAEFIGAEHTSEIIYTANATMGLNLLARSLARSKKLTAGDTILVGISDHHASIVPWLMLAEDIGVRVEFFGITDDFGIDFTDFTSKYSSRVKVVMTTWVSNVTGAILDIPQLSHLLRDDTLLVVDASQAIGHFPLEVVKHNIDFCVFTGHKIFADTGIGVLYGKRELLKELSPAFSGGGAINSVSEYGFTAAGIPDRFEPGTPPLTQAISLRAAIDWIHSIGGYPTLQTHERELSEYFLQSWKTFMGAHANIRLIGSENLENRVGVWSFVLEGIHLNDASDMLAQKGICVRSGHHCAEPLARRLGISGTLRVSTAIYSTTEDIDQFFEGMKEVLRSAFSPL